MCEMCDGRTLDEYPDRVRGLVRTHGWALQAVSGSGKVGWRSTIGLVSEEVRAGVDGHGF